LQFDKKCVISFVVFFSLLIAHIMSMKSLAYLAGIVRSHTRKSKVLVFIILRTEILGLVYYLRQKKSQPFRGFMCLRLHVKQGNGDVY
jgi:hypothetical protein